MLPCLRQRPTSVQLTPIARLRNRFLALCQHNQLPADCWSGWGPRPRRGSTKQILATWAGDVRHKQRSYVVGKRRKCDQRRGIKTARTFKGLDNVKSAAIPSEGERGDLRNILLRSFAPAQSRPYILVVVWPTREDPKLRLAPSRYVSKRLVLLQDGFAVDTAHKWRQQNEVAS